jgi:dTDP-glucose pyrophosphorylase
VVNILIPTAGIQSDDSDSHFIKALREIDSKIAIQHVYESLKAIDDARFIFVIRRADTVKFHFDDTLRLLDPDIKVIITEGDTQGSACTCMLAVDLIANDQPLIISGADQIISRNWGDIINEFQIKDYDGGAVCFDSVHPKWSYVRLGEDGLVVEAAEKRPISRYATTGQYYYKHGNDFIEAAQQMILKRASVNGKYYVCPVFNEMILAQKQIGITTIDKSQYYSLKDEYGISEYSAYLNGVGEKTT